MSQERIAELEAEVADLKTKLSQARQMANSHYNNYQRTKKENKKFRTVINAAIKWQKSLPEFSTVSAAAHKIAQAVSDLKISRGAS